MAIQFKILPQQEYLYIKSEGKDENLAEHKLYNLEMYQAIKKFSFNRILVDELDITYSNTLMDMYDLAHFYDQEMPVEARLLRLALVVKQKYEKLASFWEVVCQNLGYQFKVFFSTEKAKSWLLEEQSDPPGYPLD
jgi:hypothetical protein